MIEFLEFLKIWACISIAFIALSPLLFFAASLQSGVVLSMDDHPKFWPILIASVIVISGPMAWNETYGKSEPQPIAEQEKTIRDVAVEETGGFVRDVFKEAVSGKGDK